MEELNKAKLIFWGVILTGFILSFFLLAVIGNWAWLVWGVLILIFIFGSGLPLKIWLGIGIIKRRKEIKREISGIMEKILEEMKEKYPPGTIRDPDSLDYLKTNVMLRKKYLSELAKKHNLSEEEMASIMREYGEEVLKKHKIY